MARVAGHLYLVMTVRSITWQQKRLRRGVLRNHRVPRNKQDDGTDDEPAIERNGRTGTPARPNTLPISKVFWMLNCGVRFRFIV